MSQLEHLKTRLIFETLSLCSLHANARECVVRRDTSDSKSNGYVLDYRGSILGSGRDFYLRRRVQSGSGVCSYSLPVSTGAYFSWSKAAGA
jgi:hypothetical protein